MGRRSYSKRPMTMPWYDIDINHHHRWLHDWCWHCWCCRSLLSCSVPPLELMQVCVSEYKRKCVCTFLLGIDVILMHEKVNSYLTNVKWVVETTCDSKYHPIMNVRWIFIYEQIYPWHYDMNRFLLGLERDQLQY